MHITLAERIGGLVLISFSDNTMALYSAEDLLSLNHVRDATDRDETVLKVPEDHPFQQAILRRSVGSHE